MPLDIVIAATAIALSRSPRSACAPGGIRTSAQSAYKGSGRVASGRAGSNPDIAHQDAQQVGKGEEEAEADEQRLALRQRQQQAEDHHHGRESARFVYLTTQEKLHRVRTSWVDCKKRSFSQASEAFEINSRMKISLSVYLRNPDSPRAEI